MLGGRLARTLARPFAEAAEVLVVAARVERARTRRGPAPLVRELRARGRRRRRRDGVERRRLQRVIGLLDRCFPGGGNCYRRVLVEMALDAGAAAEPLHLGLRKDGTPGSGHAWLGEARDVDRDPARPYDAELVL